MQEAIAVEIKVGLGYCSSFRRFTVPQFRRTQQDVFNRQAKGCHWKWFNETSWNEYKIWKEHPSFGCSRMAVHNLIKKIKETGSTERCKGSGRPVKATTEKNASIFDEFVCSQEDEPGIPNSIRQISKTIEFISMVPRKMSNRNACTAKEIN